MYLQKLSLINFKNIETQSFDFQEKINCFVGDNGVGKTNVLDAIYYLSFAKSYFNSVALQNIRHGAGFFMVEGDYFLNDPALYWDGTFNGEELQTGAYLWTVLIQFRDGRTEYIEGSTTLIR